MNETERSALLLAGERLDEVNDRLRLIQKTDGLTFGTDALLLAGYVNSAVGKSKNGLEIGGGSGIISLLLAARGRIERITCVEVQKEYADLIARNVRLNGLEDRILPVCADIRDFRTEETFDTVFANPPYMTADSGKNCEKTQKEIARHEVFGTIDDWIASAARLVKYGGSFYAVYRPDRLTDLIVSLRKHRLEPKKATFVHADGESEPSSVLILAKSGGKPGMTVTPPLMICEGSDKKNETGDMKYILEYGRFPEKFGNTGRKG